MKTENLTEIASKIEQLHRLLARAKTQCKEIQSGMPRGSDLFLWYNEGPEPTYYRLDNGKTAPTHRADICRMAAYIDFAESLSSELEQMLIPPVVPVTTKIGNPSQPTVNE